VARKGPRRLTRITSSQSSADIRTRGYQGLVPGDCRIQHQAVESAEFRCGRDDLPGGGLVADVAHQWVQRVRKRRRECVQAGRGRPVIRDDGIAPAQQRLGDQQSQPAAGAGQGHHPAF
jgi:hypothetical protein